jgi:selenocysteine lyase/cysteine desulfurase
VDRVGPVVQALGDRIADGARCKGYEVLGRRTPQTGAGIVSFRKPDLESHTIVKHLKERGIVTANRSGWVRTAPHFYISPEEIDRMLAALP